MKDSWQSGDSYEYFMGRWSIIVAESFLDWLSPHPGLKWLDVGCGSGAISEIVINNYSPLNLTAIDQSVGFVKIAKKRLGRLADCSVGNALALPLNDSSVHIAISGLVLNFIPDPEKVLSEMKRVTVNGGIVAAYIWDYAGKMDFLRHFWDTVIEMDQDSLCLHEANRFQNSTAEYLRELFENARLAEIETTAIEISTTFRDFDDYWEPFQGGQGPAPTYVMSLNQSEKSRLREALYGRLPIQTDASIPMLARAWAVKGQV